MTGVRRPYLSLPLVQLIILVVPELVRTPANRVGRRQLSGED